MKILKLMAPALAAALLVAAIAATSAFATERGVLLLEGETGDVELTGEPKGTLALAIMGSEPPIQCTSVKLTGVSLSEPGPTHFKLGKDGTLQYSACKRDSIACSSVNLAGEKDAKETVLMLKDGHAINLEGEKGELLPRLAILI